MEFKDIELVEKTTIKAEAIKYLTEVVGKFNGYITRGNMKHDYLTAPNSVKREGQDSFIEGYNECMKYKLMERADGGGHDTYIAYRISEKGKQVLELAQNA